MKNFKEICKNIYKKFDSLPTWKYFICWYVLFFIFTMTIFYLSLHYASSLASDDIFTQTLVLKLSLSISGFLSFIFSLLMTDMRKNQLKNKKFWVKAKEVDELLKNVKTKLEVESVYPAYNELIKLSFGVYHNIETTRLKTIIEIKHELLP